MLQSSHLLKDEVVDFVDRAKIAYLEKYSICNTPLVQKELELLLNPFLKNLYFRQLILAIIQGQTLEVKKWIDRLFNIHTFKISYEPSRKIRTYFSALVGFAYARYHKHGYAAELWNGSIEQSNEECLIFAKSGTGPVLGLAKIIPLQQAIIDSNLQEFFTGDEAFQTELNSRRLQEISRWAVHPVFEIVSAGVRGNLVIKNLLYQKRDIVMKSVCEAVIQYGDLNGKKTVGIFSTQVIEYMLQLRFVMPRPIESVKKQNESITKLEDLYSRYWRDGRPAIYLLKTI